MVLFLISITMDIAINALQVIYDNVLVNELNRVDQKEDLKQFLTLVRKITYDWERKKRIETLANLARLDMEQWKLEHSAAHSNYTAQYPTGSGVSGHLHDWYIYQESWVLYESREKLKVAAEEKAKQNGILKQRQEEEILNEAKRRIEETKRENAIQDAMRELMKKM